MRQSTILIIIGFILLWNSGFIGAEYGLPHTGPFTLVFWRYLGLSLLMALYLFLRNKFKWYGFKVAFLNMFIGFLAHGVWLTCVLFALDNNVPAGIVALIVALQPLTTGASAYFVTGEATNLYQWFGLILGFIGVALSVGFRIDFEDSSSIFGYFIPLGSVIAITIATLIQRKMEINKEKEKLPLDQTIFYQSIATALALALPAILVEDLKTEWVPEFNYTLLWLIIAVSLAAYILMWQLIERLDTTKVASLFYLGPPITMLMAWIAFEDKVKLMDIVGMGVVFIGVFLTQLKKDKRY